MTKSVLSCERLVKVYQQGPEQLTVLDRLDLEVSAGERLAIIGASGSGKSTLLNLMGGLDDPTSGTVRVAGESFGPMNESRRARWRNRHLGFVYQFHHLLAEFSALENVAMPLLVAGASIHEARTRATAILTEVGLAERIGHRPAQLSGGERQRVAVARALVTNPRCVLMDEPTGNLDPETGERVLRLILDLNELLGISFVIVTHDHRIAHRLGRVVCLEGGALHAVASP